MSLLTITLDGKPLMPEDGTHDTDGTGWSHTRWGYRITGTDSEEIYTGVFRAGIALRYDSAEELHAAILESLARDAAEATGYWISDSTVRDMIERLQGEFGMTDSLETYDAAVALSKLSHWYWSLTADEQRELEELTREGWES